MNFKIDNKWLYEDEDRIFFDQFRTQLLHNSCNMLVKLFEKLSQTYSIMVRYKQEVFFLDLDQSQKDMLLDACHIFKSYDLTFSLSGTPYILFKFSEKGVYITLGVLNRTNINQEIAVTYKKAFIIIKSDYEVFKIKEGVKTSSGILLIPLRLKDISFLSASYAFFQQFFLSYFEFLSETNKLAKDLYIDLKQNYENLNVPFCVSELSTAYNKKMLFSNRKLVTFNKINSLPLPFSFSLIKFKKYIPDNEVNKLRQFPFYYSNCSEKERFYNFFREYYTKRNGITSSTYLDDYLRLVFLLKKEINVNIKSERKLIKEHDKLVEILSVKKVKKEEFKLKNNNSFLSIIEPQDITRIKNPHQLYCEGIINKNCVYSYLPAINRGSCMIYYTIFNNKRYTIELSKINKIFVICQVKGVCNSEPSKEVIEFIFESFVQSNPDYNFKLAI